MARVTRNYSADSKPVVIPAYEEARPSPNRMTEEEFEAAYQQERRRLQAEGKPLYRYDLHGFVEQPRRELEHRGREGV